MALYNCAKHSMQVCGLELQLVPPPLPSPLQQPQVFCCKKKKINSLIESISSPIQNGLIPLL